MPAIEQVQVQRQMLQLQERAVSSLRPGKSKVEDWEEEGQVSEDSQFCCVGLREMRGVAKL